MTHETQIELIKIALESAESLWGKPVKITPEFVIFQDKESKKAKKVTYQQMAGTLDLVIAQIRAE